MDYYRDRLPSALRTINPWVQWFRVSEDKTNSLAIGIEMGNYFISMTRNRRVAHAISMALISQKLGEYTESTCTSFIEWLNRRDTDGRKLDDFRRLVMDSEVKYLCRILYQNMDCFHYTQKPRDPYVSIQCSDGKILKIAKSLICAESQVVKDLLDFVGGTGVIPLANVSSDILLEIILFLKRKRDFEEIVDKSAAHYKGWSKAFIYRNRHILNDLHLAAEELRIQSLSDLTTPELLRHGGSHANDYSFECFHYFSGMSGNNKRGGEILEELERAKLLGGCSDGVYKKFRHWFDHIGDSGKNHLEEFKALMDSPEFKDVCYSIYRGDYRHEDLDRVFLKSSDGGFFDIVKSVAVNQLPLLRELPGYDKDSEEIEVSFTGNVLSQVIDFCGKTYDFYEIRDFRPMEECLRIVDHFEGWMTAFLKRNRGIISHLDMVS